MAVNAGDAPFACSDVNLALEQYSGPDVKIEYESSTSCAGEIFGDEGSGRVGDDV
jgi:hypothetical protein